MKITKSLTVLTLTAALLAAPFAGFAEDKQPETKTDKKLIPDKLKTCPVSGDKLDEMGKPFVMEYKDQEVKLCCKDCKKDFDKNPAKYLKKIREADKKTADKETKGADGKM